MALDDRPLSGQKRQKEQADESAIEEFELRPNAAQSGQERAQDTIGETHDEPLLIDREVTAPNLNYGSQVHVDPVAGGGPDTGAPDAEILAELPSEQRGTVRPAAEAAGTAPAGQPGAADPAATSAAGGGATASARAIPPSPPRGLESDSGTQPQVPDIPVSAPVFSSGSPQPAAPAQTGEAAGQAAAQTTGLARTPAADSSSATSEPRILGDDAAKEPAVRGEDDGGGNDVADAVRPAWTFTIDNATIAENSADGSLLGTISSDNAPPGVSFSFALADDAGGRFQIDADSGQITVANAGLLDHEADSSLSLTVEATSSAGHVYSETFTVDVGDVNEAPTGLALSNASIAENSAPGGLVGSLSVNDPDAADTASFALTGGASHLFEVVGDQLRVKAGANLDHEAADSHSVTVTATDGVGNSHSQSFTIAVGDVNEAPTGLALSNDTIGEAAKTGDAVGTVSASDPESPAETFTYSLLDSAGGRFQIDADTGVITVADGSLLDFETAVNHGITVQVTDSAGHSYSDSFTINLTDDSSESQVSAVVDVDGTADTVSESAPDGSLVGVTALASDADATDSVTYSLSDDAGGRFQIDTNSGVTTVADSDLLDYETDTSHTVTVVATSSDGSTSSQTFTIDLTDDTIENDVSPIADSDLAANTVSESAADGTPVGITALANDADAGDTVSYSLSDDAGGRFQIDADTGVITVANSSLLDYETATSHAVTVVATSTDGSTSTETFTINLSDDTSESQVSAVIDVDGTANTVSESAADGTPVGIAALATDADTTDGVTYSLSDDAGGRFQIDPNSGVITVADASLLDFETATSHDVTVVATSTDGSTSSQSFTIDLTDDTTESQVSAVADVDGAANSVSESAADGTAVGVTALASDPDATDSITYSLSDDAGGRFQIDANTGVISVADNTLLDYETATSHDVTVVATSSDGSTSSETFTIGLTDDTTESQASAVVDDDSATNSVFESAANGTPVGVTALASDADATDSVTYSPPASSDRL